MIALSVLLSRFFSFRIPLGGVDAIRIGFGGLPIILAGIYYGPLAGGIVGAIADIVGYIISPMGAYLPHFTFVSFLTGFIPGLIVSHIIKDSKNYWGLVLAIAIGQGITTLLLIPYFLYSLFGQPFLFNFIPRLISFPLQVPIFAYFLRTLLSYLPVNYARDKTS